MSERSYVRPPTKPDTEHLLGYCIGDEMWVLAMFPGNGAQVVPFTTGPRGDEHFRGFGPESVWRKPGSERHVDLREETSCFKLP